MKIVFLIAVIFAVARFFIPTHTLSAAGSYEAFAHLFVGGLFGAWLVSKNKYYLLIFLALSAVELIVFLLNTNPTWFMK